MDEVKFWEIVGAVHDQADGEMDAKCELIGALLARLSAEEASAFFALFGAMMDRAYAWPLWGAAYVINGGCSDDSFSDFRAALISRGQAAFERALADPDALASEDFDEEAWFYEGYQYAVREGVEAAVGAAVRRQNPPPDEPSGEAWEEAAVYERYPQLAERFG